LQKLAHAVEKSALQLEVTDLRRVIGTSTDHHIVGASPAICRVREALKRIARTDATVLLTGESGTGKELAARALHDLSPRANERFVAVNCGALPGELLESELFGHVKGAFTGATQDREGVFGSARRGTLFLDEIGEATPAVQVRLLRTLEARVYTRVGSTREEIADVRLVAASNRDLAQEVAERRFREDLYYRLRVVPLEMPTLRERPDDIPLLADLFLTRSAARHGMRVPRLSRQALDAMLLYPWPGNVRELRNELEAALVLAASDVLDLEHLRHVARHATSPTPAASLAAHAPAPGDVLPPLKEARDAFERAYLRELLRRCGGNVSAAARHAGRNRSDFYDLLRRHAISPSEFKPTS
jgi:two-component system response regulator GlrR